MFLPALNFCPLATLIGLTISLHFCLASCSTSVHGETANVSTTHSPVNLAQNLSPPSGAPAVTDKSPQFTLILGLRELPVIHHYQCF